MKNQIVCAKCGMPASRVKHLRIGQIYICWYCAFAAFQRKLRNALSGKPSHI